jgi:hypothetical protein
LAKKNFAEKLSAEYAAEIAKMEDEAEASRREKISQSRRGETREIIPASKQEETRTSTQRAKAVGTNRKYLEVAKRIAQGGEIA